MNARSGRSTGCGFDRRHKVFKCTWDLGKKAHVEKVIWYRTFQIITETASYSLWSRLCFCTTNPFMHVIYYAAVRPRPCTLTWREEEIQSWYQQNCRRYSVSRPRGLIQWMVGRWVYKEAEWPIWKHYSSILFDMLRKTTKNLGQDDQ
jgi:hypothetical protein